MRASQWNHLQIVKYLHEQGSDIYARDKDGNTALDLAKREGHTEVVQFRQM